METRISVFTDRNGIYEAPRGAEVGGTGNGFLSIMKDGEVQAIFPPGHWLRMCRFEVATPQEQFWARLVDMIPPDKKRDYAPITDPAQIGAIFAGALVGAVPHDAQPEHLEGLRRAFQAASIAMADRLAGREDGEPQQDPGPIGEYDPQGDDA